MEWQYFTKVAERVTNLTKKLEGETDTIEQICKSYLELLQEEGAKPKEWEDFNELTKCLKKVQAELRNVQEKAASEEILIKFAGATSSGKSSLINALLRSRRVPVGFMQTTMCSIKVCTTEKEEWSVTVTNENGETECLSSSKSEKEVRDLLSNMSGKNHADKREEMRIGTRSVVQVNWPKHLCNVLPLNVVLFDTPGLGEDFESDKVVIESCREADIIVAVMDVMSPSKATVARLVNNVNCQFTFGVFTKWDECMRRQEESEDAVDVEQTREGYKRDFRNALEGQCEMFFVDVKCANTDDVEFKTFERKLQASATILKGESLIKQAKSVNKESIDIAGKLKGIVDAKEEQKKKNIEKKQASMKEDEVSFYKMKRSLRSAEKSIKGAYEENKKRIKEFEERVKKGEPEDEAHAKFIAKVDECTRETLVSGRNEIRSAFKEWADNHIYDLDVNTFVSDKIPLCEKQGLTEEEYNWKWDANVYLTNDYLSAALLLGGSVGVTIAGTAGVAGLAGMLAAQSLSSVAGTTVLGSTLGGTGGLGGTRFGLFRFGNLIKSFFPISDYKVGCWREKLGGNLRKLDRDCRDLTSNDIKRIEDEASKKLDHAKVKKVEKIQNEEEKLHNLTSWATELQESHTGLTERNKEFDELLAEMLKKVADESPPRETQPHECLPPHEAPCSEVSKIRSNNPTVASEDHTENQSTIDSTGTESSSLSSLVLNGAMGHLNT